ncbi:molybdenum cofactor biosynthesis protein MoaE [Gracilibacillus caseinilyticus]|uniref:Molybdenum cofactor biosynthesis protein MoaE n=1 Tax=Gracilibacillus caseinilyticus TaxID=2932256 RepID=A0ABY4EW02_9BACI|nr:molybdenum cofactor biosynthesis protein MoaE [Gracilibacillus caseinilyticus]UOQ48155.1 molybdenum cofactor biosynthesis protein MoaE [Gracilibacillus caseinilyticus]
MPSKHFEIVKNPIDINAIIQKVEDRNAGAITTFIGTVRELTGDKRTIYLEYQAYKPMAEKMLEQVGQEIGEKWSGTHVAITHRIGSLNISDIAVVIAVSSPHRKPAYQANEYAIERIKQIVPIWKKEQWEDGAAWIGDQLENVPYPTGKPEINGGDQDD